MTMSNQSLKEKLEMDREIAEMEKYPIDYSDIPPVRETALDQFHFGNEKFLRTLPPDILKELARRRLDDIERITAQKADLVEAGK